jgi:hypothetical protein
MRLQATAVAMLDQTAGAAVGSSRGSASRNADELTDSDREQSLPQSALRLRSLSMRLSRSRKGCACTFEEFDHPLGATRWLTNNTMR